MLSPLRNPAHSKTRYSAPITITQIKNGVTSSGPVTGSGGVETILSDGHDISHLGSGDCGGPMILHRTMKWYSAGTELSSSFGTRGSQVVFRPTLGLPGTVTQPVRSTLWGQGGTAIARTLPTRPAFDGGNAIAESIGVRTIPKMVGSSLWRQRTLEFKSLGDEYLNVQFGWLPFIDDIKSCMHAVIDSDDYMRSLRKGSDHKTRVGYAFPDEFTQGYDSTSGGLLSSYSGSSGSYTQPGAITLTTVTGSETWFKGCFYYHLPATTGNVQKSAKYRSYAEHVLGLRLTPEQLWNAAPWTWAVDWAINVGDVARNIGALGHDGLILQYGYIMSHKQDKRTWTAMSNSTHRLSGNISTTFIEEWKVRWPASPYGFGLTYDGLSLKQKSILAAIGITHW